MQNDYAIRVEKAIEYIVNMEAGTSISHLNMETLLGVERRNGPYHSLVGRVRRGLILKSRFLKTLPKIGYYVCRPEDEIVVCQGRKIRGMRATLKAIRDQAYINVTQIADPEKRKLVTDTVNRDATLAGMMSNHMQQLTC